MTNIAELLKDAPTGMKLYSPLFGEVEFVRIDKQSIYPIDVKDCKGNGKSFTEFGVYFAEHLDADCLLFPSKDCRTWEGWKLPSEPKFEVGDWVVGNDGETFSSGKYAEQITLIEVDEMGKCIWLSSKTWVNDDDIHPWAISDARDGDVLAADNGWTCIFRAFDGYVFSSYCFMDSQKWFCESGSEVHTLDSRINGNIHPATKEQCNQFFTKMKEAGYQWDGEKKELKRIQPHYDIANFHAGMPVLVRVDESDDWRYVQFSHVRAMPSHRFVAGAGMWNQCIPFEGNKKLLGTTEQCGEEFINW